MTFSHQKPLKEAALVQLWTSLPRGDKFQVATLLFSAVHVHSDILRADEFYKSSGCLNSVFSLMLFYFSKGLVFLGSFWIQHRICNPVASGKESHPWKLGENWLLEPKEIDINPQTSFISDSVFLLCVVLIQDLLWGPAFLEGCLWLLIYSVCLFYH